MKILVSAFDAFAGERVNPAALALDLLPETIAGAQIEKVLVPTVFGKSLDRLIEKIEEVQPDAILCVGQAGGRGEITPEKVAINLIDARIPDNEGNQPIDERIAADGENAYFSTLPIKAMVHRMREEEIPAALSFTAGSFVCNYLMYGLMHYLSGKEDIRGGFVHVPYLPEQSAGMPGIPSMDISLITQGLIACLEVIAEQGEDLHVSEGREF